MKVESKGFTFDSLTFEPRAHRLLVVVQRGLAATPIELLYGLSIEGF